MEKTKRRGYSWIVNLQVLVLLLRLGVLFAALQVSTAQSCPVTGCIGCGTTSVTCHHAGLSSFPELPLDVQQRVEELDLQYNNLGMLDAGVLEHYTNLTTLYLSYNQLTELPDGLLTTTTQLQFLGLYGNQLTVLPDGLLATTTQLQTLGLYGNQLTVLPDGLLNATTQLTHLYLSNNQLTELPDGLLATTTQLQELELRSNQLTELPDGLLNATTELQRLVLKTNQLTELPDGLLTTTTQLQLLYLSYNQLTELPDDLLATTTELQTLYLNSNQLTELPDGLLATTTQLQELRLSNNQLTELPDGLLATTTQLQTLSLGGNQLTELPDGLLATTTQLERLYLSSSQLTELPDGLLATTTQLQTLSLSSNQLTELPDGLLATTTQLQYLVLSGNQLTELPDGLFNATTQLQELLIDNNPLHCDCKLRWLPLYLSSATDLDYESATCANPANLAGIEIDSLTEDQFVCEYPTVSMCQPDDPSSPGTVTVTNSFNCEAIVWEPPSSTGGGITGYTVRVYYRVNGQQTVGSTTTHNISDPDRHWLAPTTLPQQRPLYYQVKARNLAGESQWSDESVLNDCQVVTPPAMLFQLQITGIPDCREWATTETEVKLGDIHDELLAQVNQLCGCGLTPPHITAGELQCVSSSTEVTYRARISGTTTASSSDILAYLDKWIRSGTAALLLQGVRFFLDSSCLPVEIGSFTDPKCGSEGSPSDAEGSDTTAADESDSTAAIIGGMVAVVVVVTCALTLIIAMVVTSRRRAMFSLRKGEREGGPIRMAESEAYVVRPQPLPPRPTGSEGPQDCVSMQNTAHGRVMPATTHRRPHTMSSSYDNKENLGVDDEDEIIPGEIL